MAPLRYVGVSALLLAWVAFLLPWERCDSDCHDHVVSALAHDCHEHDCPEHEEDEEADHESFDFVSRRPSAAPVLDLAPAASFASVLPAPARPVDAARASATDVWPPGLARSVVLLL